MPRGPKGEKPHDISNMNAKPSQVAFMQMNTTARDERIEKLRAL